ncbi:hypothetical protein ACFW9V_05420 [Streptomyces hygroscopicus]|uniref:hypothetical protein n=1 Tax=Streptomyces hygroscopicus TaxID=1912 RepID=UPI0036B9BBBB
MLGGVAAGALRAVAVNVPAARAVAPAAVVVRRRKCLRSNVRLLSLALVALVALVPVQ